MPQPFIEQSILKTKQWRERLGGLSNPAFRKRLKGVTRKGGEASHLSIVEDKEDDHQSRRQ